jgi:hypothetical protein
LKTSPVKVASGLMCRESEGFGRLKDTSAIAGAFNFSKALGIVRSRR